MTIFVDSSVWFAAVFARDARHAAARKILSEEAKLVSSDHVVVETWLLLRSRFNHAAAEAFCQRIMSGWCHIEIVALSDLRAVESVRLVFDDQTFSLIDRTSFVVMERLGVNRVASFDDDFLIYRYGPNRDRAFEVLR